jgi:hypothetical protein
MIVLPELLKLTHELDIDILTNVMETFVETFSKELTPYSVQLCQQLKDSFLRLMEETNISNLTGDDNDYDDMTDKTMAAIGILKTIATLVISVQSSPELLAEIEQALLPCIVFTLQNQIIGKAVACWNSSL